MKKLIEVINNLAGIFGINGKENNPDPIEELEVAASAEEKFLEQVELYLGPRDNTDTLSSYMKEDNDLLYNAAFEGRDPSIKLPASFNAAKKKGYIIAGFYQFLEDKLRNAPDVILQDKTALAILATIAFYDGISFRALNKFSEAYPSLSLKLRENFEAPNDEIYNAFRSLLDSGYIAQGISKNRPIIVGTAKLDTYLSRNSPTPQ